MKKSALGLILGILLVGLIGVVSAEENNTNYNVSCETDDDCKLAVPSELSECRAPCDLYGCTIYQDENSKVVAINTDWTPDCPEVNQSENITCITCAGGVQINDYEAKCVDNECVKVETDDDDEDDEEENETEIQRCLQITNKTLCEAKNNCEWNNVTGKCVKTTKIKRLKDTLQAYLNSTECPEDCVCAGSTIKCETENGRTMTVVAERSGNIIIITKTANASTTVILIKNATGLYGNFTGKLKRIKYLPDEIKERVLKKLKITNATSYNMTLKEDGSYEMTINGKYRVLWIFPKKTIVVAGINSETGEIIVLKKPWWKFIAS